MINQQLSSGRQALQRLERVLNLAFLLLLIAATDSAGIPEKVSRRNHSGAEVLASIAGGIVNGLAGDPSLASVAPDLAPCSIALLLRLCRPSTSNKEVES